MFWQGAGQGFIVAALNHAGEEIFGGRNIDQIEDGDSWNPDLPTTIEKGKRLLVVENENYKYVDIESRELQLKHEEAYFKKYPNRNRYSYSHISIVKNARIAAMFETLFMTQSSPGIGMLGGDTFIESINPGNSFTPKYQQELHIKIRNAQYQQANYYRQWGIIH